jgi:23S rRNA (adenine2030-N6)-methyltransferase
VRALHEAVVATGVRRVVAADFLIRPAIDATRLNGCGLLLINPPWTLADDLERLLSRFADTLADPGPGAARVEQLVGE